MSRTEVVSFLPMPRLNNPFLPPTNRLQPKVTPSPLSGELKADDESAKVGRAGRYLGTRPNIPVRVLQGDFLVVNI